MGLVTRIKRIEKVSCAHRLHAPALSAGENREIFGKCNNEFGHGHNYTFEATVKGPVHPQTGMVINIAILKVLMQKVLDQIDHKFIDREVPYFTTVPSTAENIAAWFYAELSAELAGVKTLDDAWELEVVTVFETDKNIASVSIE